MVEQQIRARGLSNPSVLEALRKVSRHEFVPAPFIDEAYADKPLPIGFGQTISQPFIVGYMSELLRLSPDHSVLEIGTGCGYQAAILSRLAARVYSIEIIEPLGRAARARLQKLGYSNVEVRIGDGYQGWPEHAPFDRIILTAAPTKIPQALIDQLAPGGRLLAPVGPQYGAQDIVIVDKDRDGRVRRRTDIPVRFVPMVSSEQKPDQPRN